MTVREKLHNIALKAPETSGVYLWKDEAGTIIYVGKAKSLKNRLTSYFAKNNSIKTKILVSRAADLEYIETKTEYEALLLENTLIKKHKPKYNISLKDGKTYPVIKLTNEMFPAVFKTRIIKDDGAFYFGPFPNVYAVDNFLNLVKQNYKLRQCRVLRKRKTPCLYYHIGRCSAPCCGKISAEEYNAETAEVKKLLTNTNTVEALTKQMQACAKNMDFEKAKRLRDGIQSILALHNQNVVEDMNGQARDYIAWFSNGALITFTVLKMRNGKLVARDLYRTQSLKDDSEVLQEFIPEYYAEGKNVPAEIFVLQNGDNNSPPLMQTWFSDQLGMHTVITELPLLMNTGNEAETNQAFDTNIKKDNDYAAEKYEHYFSNELQKTIATSKADENIAEDLHIDVKEFRHHRAALSMAYFNAKEDVARRIREYGDWQGLEELKNILNLDVLPARIEGFDIAHLEGTFTVASMVSFKDGNPDKKNYRLFRLRTTEGINDDYASMKEVVARRYSRLINEEQELPDLILIDGGLGQVNVAYKVLQALKLDIPAIGLAERNEEIIFPNNPQPLVLPRRSAALRLLQRVRDEAHRFATTRNKKLREKAETVTLFEKLPHVSERRAKVLMENAGTMQKLSSMSVENIAKLLAVGEKQAQDILTSAREFIKAGHKETSSP